MFGSPHGMPSDTQRVGCSYKYTQHNLAQNPRVFVRCDPRFKWLSVVTIYVVCIVCLLDACPLPPSQLDHNTCASNPEQANSQVKIPFVIDPQQYFQIYYATILDVLCSTVTSLSLDFIIFTVSFSSFISLSILPCVS